MLVCGVDEAGRGALAGPVVSAAVIYGGEPTPNLRDSKKLSAKERRLLSEKIIDECLAYAIGISSVEEINQCNIRQATSFSMQRAVNNIVICPDLIQVDGDFTPQFPYPAEFVIRGDDKIPSIMAASILAKVHRDQIMEKLSVAFPQYLFSQHKGYPTAQHKQALAQHGVSLHHRIHYAPVKALLNEPKRL